MTFQKDKVLERGKHCCLRLILNFSLLNTAAWTISSSKCIVSIRINPKNFCFSIFTFLHNRTGVCNRRDSGEKPIYDSTFIPSNIYKYYKYCLKYIALVAELSVQTILSIFLNVHISMKFINQHNYMMRLFASVLMGVKQAASSVQSRWFELASSCSLNGINISKRKYKISENTSKSRTDSQLPIPFWLPIRSQLQIQTDY